MKFEDRGRSAVRQLLRGAISGVRVGWPKARACHPTMIDDIETSSGDPDKPSDEGQTPEGTAHPWQPSAVVGIGASAGGLDPLMALIKEFTVDSMAFIVVSHLSPNHESMLPELLARVAHMTVEPITDGCAIQRNHIYVAPPNANVAVLHGVLQLMTPRGPGLPIDFFFRSLAEDLGPNAIGVVLSGMGHDGSVGLHEIRTRGGLTFCQEPRTAKFDSMPLSAIATGSVDRVLSPGDLGRELMDLSKHSFLLRGKAQTEPRERDDLAKLFILLRSRFGNDLSAYKTTTITRRVARRMALTKIDTMADYVRVLQQNGTELESLYADLLIGVTSFFRDSEPWDVLKAVVIPRILERKPDGATIRVWVPACAGGEEAYTIAICLLESLAETGRDCRIQIFATDVDAHAIDRARRGVFPVNIELDVSSDRLSRFFERTPTGYSINRKVRDTIVFSIQNVPKDAPFSRLDVVSCRNLLIYLQPPLQKKVLRLFNYALGPDGYLLLGSSETVGESADLFSLIDRKNKFYIKKNLPAAVRPDSDHSALLAPLRPEGSDARLVSSVKQMADRKLLDQYGPPSALVNENFEVMQFRGDMGPFLSPKPGDATLQLLKLLRAELHVEVWRGLQRSREENVPSRLEPIKLPSARAGEKDVIVTCSIVPITESDTKVRCFLIVFEERRTLDPSHAPPSSDAPRVGALEHELAATREYLQTSIEELETTNEELKSTNEELQSSNEELQSTNEELETSKEELQSMNEELSTLNNELHHRMMQLSQSSDDVRSLMSNVDQAVCFLDERLALRLASTAAQRVLGLTQSDLGRNISQLRPFFGGIDVERAARKSVERQARVVEQFRSSEGRWFELRALPYQTTVGQAASGALLLLRDIHSEKKDAELLVNVAAYADNLLRAIPHPLAILDEQQRVVWVNAAFLDTFKATTHDTLGNLFHRLGSGEWADPRLRALIESALKNGKSFADFRVDHSFGTLGARRMRVGGSMVEATSQEERLLLLSIEDLTPSPEDATPPRRSDEVISDDGTKQRGDGS